MFQSLSLSLSCSFHFALLTRGVVAYMNRARRAGFAVVGRFITAPPGLRASAAHVTLFVTERERTNTRLPAIEHTPKHTDTHFRGPLYARGDIYIPV